jgi:hypothetical protein
MPLQGVPVGECHMKTLTLAHGGAARAFAPGFAVISQGRERKTQAKKTPGKRVENMSGPDLQFHSDVAVGVLCYRPEFGLSVDPVATGLRAEHRGDL